jgi:hypothetical protein
LLVLQNFPKKLLQFYNTLNVFFLQFALRHDKKMAQNDLAKMMQSLEQIQNQYNKQFLHLHQKHALCSETNMD